MPRFAVLGLLLILVLAACGTPAPSPVDESQQQLPVVTVYKPPS